MTEAMTDVSEPRPALSQESIVAAAVVMADDGGLDALSMRSLARSLGYEVMSLYNHVANKHDLLTLMADHVATGIESPSSGSDTGSDTVGDERPMELIRELALSARRSLARHSWATSLWHRHVPGPARLHFMEMLLALFSRAGLADDLAHFGFHAVVNHVVGYTVQEQQMMAAFDDGDDPHEKAREFLDSVDVARHPHVVAHVEQHLAGETGSSFELVLDLILDGLVRLNHER